MHNLGMSASMYHSTLKRMSSRAVLTAHIQWRIRQVPYIHHLYCFRTMGMPKAKLDRWGCILTKHWHESSNEGSYLPSLGTPKSVKELERPLDVWLGW